MAKTVNITEFANLPTTRNFADWFDFASDNGLTITPIPYEVKEQVYGCEPDERVFFDELCPCGRHCGGNHPHASVNRYRDWYVTCGQDRRAGIHVSGMEFYYVTRDRDDAIRVAKEHLSV